MTCKFEVSDDLLERIESGLKTMDYLIGGPYPVYRLSEGHIDGQIFQAISRLESCLEKLLRDNGHKGPKGARQSQDLSEDELIEYGFDLEGE